MRGLATYATDATFCARACGNERKKGLSDVIWMRPTRAFDVMRQLFFVLFLSSIQIVCSSVVWRGFFYFLTTYDEALIVTCMLSFVIERIIALFFFFDAAGWYRSMLKERCLGARLGNFNKTELGRVFRIRSCYMGSQLLRGRETK